MAATPTQLAEHLREHALICKTYGSPLMALLLDRMAADFEAGGPVADLIGQWMTHPGVDALSMRLCGALHAGVLTGRDPALAAQYPEQRADWNIATLWPLARAFLARERAWVAEFIRSAPQTNEVRRAIALLPGFLTFANTHNGEIDLLEIGASAGLNLNWDRFYYRTDQWHWGHPGRVTIDTDWRGPAPPLGAAPRIRSRAGCDLNPLDVSEREQRLRLRSYIWADQLDRLARFDAAADLAVASGQKVDRADAADWLERRLDTRAKDAATLVYHSLFLQYPAPPVRAAIIAAIERAGATATREAPVAWLRLEPEALLGVREGTRFAVDLTVWPNGERHLLAFTDGHGRSVEALCAGVWPLAQ